MKKILITIMGLLLILSLFSFSDIASAKTKKSVKKKSFTVHNVYKIYYSKVDSKTTGVITETGPDRKSTRLNSSHLKLSRMPSSA